MFKEYSVLMSVYVKEHASYFDNSINSMLKQTKKTNDFVIVCDGKLTEELNEVIHKYDKEYPGLFSVVRLEKNVGLGKALEYGLQFCKNELIARMDSDDYSLPDRCEEQIKIFNKLDGVDVVSGIIEEFDTNIDCVISVRSVPEKNNDIKEFSKLRSPFNHMAVMFKKNSVKMAGGYQDFFHVEDYYLWVRMLAKGAIGYNIQKPLVRVRGGRDLYLRRGGFKYLNSQLRLLIYMKKIKYITFYDFSTALFLRVFQAFSPVGVREFCYKYFFRD